MLISPHHWDGWSTMEGRHLVFAYVAVAAIQLGYAGYIGWQWLALRKLEGHQVKSNEAARSR